MKNKNLFSQGKKRFFIFGHYGEKNTGDDTILFVLLNELAKRYPKTKFAVLSNNPLNIHLNINNEVIEVHHHPLSVFNEIRKSSVFIMGGGTQIFDTGIMFTRLVILLKIFLILTWAKIVCREIWFVGIGIEKLSTFWGKILGKLILKIPTFISVRDRYSYDLIIRMGYENKLELSFDLAALLFCNKKLEDKKLDNNKKILGISLLPFFEIYKRQNKNDDLLIKEIGKSLNQWLIQNRKNYVYIFEFKGGSRSDDVAISKQLKEQLLDGRVKYIEYNKDPSNTLASINLCDYFIGMRYHSCIFAYLTNKPMLIINYFHKCEALANDIGLNPVALLSPYDIINGDFNRNFNDFLNNPKKYLPTLPIKQSIFLANRGIPCRE